MKITQADDVPVPDDEIVESVVGELGELDDWWWGLCGTMGCWHSPLCHDADELGSCLFCSCGQFKPRIK